MKINEKDLKKIIIALLICFLAIWKVYILTPTQDKIKEAEKDLKNIQTNIATLKEKYKELLNKKIEHKLIKEKNKESEAYIIKDNTEFTKIINDIYSLAKTNNLVIQSSSTGASKSIFNADLKIFLQLSLRGSYKDFLMFLNNIYTLPASILIKDIDIAKTDKKNLLNISLKFYGFELKK